MRLSMLHIERRLTELGRRAGVWAKSVLRGPLLGRWPSLKAARRWTLPRVGLRAVNLAVNPPAQASSSPAKVSTTRSLGDILPLAAMHLANQAKDRGSWWPTKAHTIIRPSSLFSESRQSKSPV